MCHTEIWLWTRVWSSSRADWHSANTFLLSQQNGVKVWTLADSDTGYIHQLQVYTGKEGSQEKGLAQRFVTNLLGHMQHKNVRVFMDNFYSSTSLFTELAMRDIQACGTVRRNRKGLPTALLHRNIALRKHEYKVAQKDDLTCCIWQDTKMLWYCQTSMTQRTLESSTEEVGKPYSSKFRCLRWLPTTRCTWKVWIMQIKWLATTWSNTDLENMLNSLNW